MDYGLLPLASLLLSSLSNLLNGDARFSSAGGDVCNEWKSYISPTPEPSLSHRSQAGVRWMMVFIPCITDGYTKQVIYGFSPNFWFYFSICSILFLFNKLYNAWRI